MLVNSDCSLHMQCTPKGHVIMLLHPLWTNHSLNPSYGQQHTNPPKYGQLICNFHNGGMRYYSTPFLSPVFLFFFLAKCLLLVFYMVQVSPSPATIVHFDIDVQGKPAETSSPVALKNISDAKCIPIWKKKF